MYAALIMDVGMGSAGLCRWNSFTSPRISVSIAKLSFKEFGRLNSCSLLAIDVAPTTVLAWNRSFSRYHASPEVEVVSTRSLASPFVNFRRTSARFSSASRWLAASIPWRISSAAKFTSFHSDNASAVLTYMPHSGSTRRSHARTSSDHCLNSWSDILLDSNLSGLRSLPESPCAGPPTGTCAARIASTSTFRLCTITSKVCMSAPCACTRLLMKLPQVCAVAIVAGSPNCASAAANCAIAPNRRSALPCNGLFRR